MKAGKILENINNKYDTQNDKIVYIIWFFDALHKGIIEALEKVKKPRDFVFAGVYDNASWSIINGKYFPILFQSEKILNLFSLKYVDVIF